MASIDRPPAKGNLGSFALRADEAPEQPDPHPDPCGEPVGYAFDAVPKSIRHDRRLKALDHQIVAILVGLAIWRRDSCWTTMRFVASRVPAIRPGRSGLAVACDRTAQRSIRRLMTFGHLRREAVAVPDPDDPRNTTGYRYFFNWHLGQPAAPGAKGGVTKDRGGVTKGQAEPSGPPGGVPSKSPDSLVTQVNIEVGEQESTLNVAALAPGDGEPGAATDPAPGGEIPPAPSTGPTRQFRAWEVVEKLWRRGVRWRAGADGRPAWYLPTASIDPPTPLAEAVMRELAAEVRAELRSRGVPIPGDDHAEGSVLAPKGKLASKVPPAVQADVRARLGRLRRAGTTNPEVLSTALALVEALGPHRDEGRTVATFLEMCGAVRSGTMPEATLHDAFEEACGPRSEVRGAVFIASVKRWR